MLNQANTYYTLATDVSTPGTAFLIANDGISLGLGGHTVTYGQTLQPTIANAMFDVDSLGTGPTISNWSIVGPSAASAVIVADDADPLSGLYYPAGQHFFSTRHLRLTVPASGTCTLTNPGNVATLTTGTAHGMSTGDRVYLNAFYSVPDVTDTFYKVTVTGANTFTLQGVTMTSVSDETGVYSPATVLLSDPITIDEANVYYAATIAASDRLPSQGSHINLIELVQDGATLPELRRNPIPEVGTGLTGNCQAPVAGNTRSDKPVSVTTPSNTHNVQVRVLIANTVSTTTQQVFISRARLTKAYRCGVVITGQSYSQFPPYHNWSAGVQSAYRAAPPVRTWTIEDSPTGPVGAGGQMLQGSGRSYRGYGIESRGLQGYLTLRDITINLNGDDCPHLLYGSTSSLTVGTVTLGGSAGRGCVFSYSTDVMNTRRMTGYSSVMGSSPAGVTDLVCSYNTFTGYPQAAISPPFRVTQTTPIHRNLLIEHNTFYPRAVIADPYAISCQPGTVSCTVRNNVIDALTNSWGSGHGLYMSSIKGLYQNVTVDSNDVRVKFLGCGETLNAGNARALRFRGTEGGVWTAGMFKNIVVSNNVFQAQSGPGSNDPITTMILSYLPSPYATLALVDGTKALVTTSGGFTHGLVNGDLALLLDFTSTPTVYGWHPVTVVSSTSFTVAVPVTAIAGSVGRYVGKPDLDTLASPTNIVFSNNTHRAIAMDPAHLAIAVHHTWESRPDGHLHRRPDDHVPGRYVRFQRLLLRGARHDRHPDDGQGPDDRLHLQQEHDLPRRHAVGEHRAR